MQRWLLACLLVLPAGAQADEVHLRGGRRVRGVVVERTDTTIVVDTGPGRIGIPLARVEKVVTGRSALQRYRQRAARLPAGDVSGWLALAAWAHDNDLLTQSRQAYERVLAAEPDNAAAQRALGRVRVQGHWMSHADAQRARGLVLFEGQWMSPAEHAARIALRTAEERTRAAQAEAEQRVREAEARARTAEAAAREAQAQAAAGTSGLPLWIGPGLNVVSREPVGGCDASRTRQRAEAQRKRQAHTKTARKRRPLGLRD